VIQSRQAARLVKAARMMVLSIIRYWLSRSAVRAVNTRSRTPAWHQRLKRWCTVFHLPYRSGRSLQCAPDPKIHKYPFTNTRLSEAVRPRSPAFPGSSGEILAHCASFNSYRLADIHLLRVESRSSMTS
jgi:hypothetical protein